uniref:F420-dependent NADP reductase n=2 Tax=Candidatus Methanogaster sp. ANME-2c ERB4 TaxID=2759911 RepID=A0A7G9Y7P3_9EURY|nr:F420-dependent NADP reductase [Methanosarcinales archaeon ANME-2c ERB4]QNO43468.1 F420-dependent NADP reductase [Methanosarcinales archaeon ANME-2c ERB4]QNO44027.1 F420-dependent NADP reductase [Methanosarcinales archaeon ANME-2c ERB4]
MHHLGYMKIAILGGTGDIGEGFALNWAENHHIRIGSRKADKAEAAAKSYRDAFAGQGMKGNILGFDNRTAAEGADVIILTVPHEHVPGVIDTVRPVLDHQIIISPVVPITKSEYFEYNPPAQGSAAEEILERLPEGTSVVAAYHTIASGRLCSLDPVFRCDVMICGNDRHSKDVVIDLTDEIECLRPLDAGPLAAARTIESLTPMLLNLAMLNDLKDPSIKIL